MRTLLNGLLLAVLIVCTGCPYESSFPVTGTKTKYHAALPGSWHTEESELSIKRIDDVQVSYEYRDLSEGETMKGKAYLVTIDKTPFFVADLREGDRAKYLTFKLVSITKDRLSIIPLDDSNVASEDDDEPFSNAAEFTRFVRTATFDADHTMNFERGRKPKQ